MAGNLSLTREYARIFSIVADRVQPVLFDIVSTKTSLLFRYREMGAIMEVGGRPHLRFTIMKELPTTVGYSDDDTITPVRGDPVTSVIYEWKQLATPVLLTGLDMIKTGDEGIEDLITLFINTASISQRDAIGGSSVGIYSSLNESDLTGISGLQTFFTSSTTTGSVGQLSRAVQSNWRHKTQNISSDFSGNGLDRMETLYRQCSQFDENVDTIAVTGSFMDNFKKNVTRTHSTNLPLIGVAAGDEAMIDAGFPNIRFNGAILFDDDGCPANAGYFLNLKTYMRLIVRRGRASEIGDFVKAQNKDNISTHVLFAGAQVTTNLKRGGLIRNGDTN